MTKSDEHDGNLSKQSCCHSHATQQTHDPSITLVRKDTMYTCPMHPEIIQSSPGICPICGMSLEALLTASHDTADEEYHYFYRRFCWSLILTLPIVLVSMGREIPILKELIAFIPATLSMWGQCVLATFVVTWCAKPLLHRALLSLNHFRFNMFTLIGLGIVVSYTYSVVIFLFPSWMPVSLSTHTTNNELYFESAAVITTLVLLGQVLELLGRNKTGKAIRDLMNLSPKMARKIFTDGSESDVNLSEVIVGDRIRVLPGARIPVDGTVINGSSSVDESMVTGESIPVEKTTSMKVIGGTLNLTGSFVVRADYVAADTVLAQMIQQVADAQRSRAPIQKIADKVSGFFVPAVMIIAMMAFIIWSWIGPFPAMANGLVSAISVLIIACPCALGLATPMSIMVGMGRGAQAGILIKDAESLERFETINLLIVDKTGTLTIGKPVVNKIIVSDGNTESDVLLLAASLERLSEHPLATAILTAASERHISFETVSDFSAEVGMGMLGMMNGKRVALGNIALLKKLQLTVERWEQEVTALRLQGATVMYAVSGDQIIGLISVIDPVKATSKLALNLLREIGIDVVMLTGDHVHTAKAVADTLGILHVEAGVLATEKQSVVKRYQQQGYKVAMAGDGINDAAALAASDIGIAMGTGTDIAKQSASITLVKGDLLSIVHARQLSHQVMRNIRQNLFLAFIYNLLCVPIAAGVLYPWFGILLSPMIAAAAMSLSSASVIFNAIRLRHMRFV